MEQSEQPLLSICIPTYNRAEYLKKTLIGIVNDKDFDDTVEIVISDNASTDHTQQVCREFCNVYHNIHYYRNDVNIITSNFFLALNRGKGKYVKLSNDTVTYKVGALKALKDEIKRASTSKNLFFFQNNEFHTDLGICFRSLNQFMNISNYYITWIVNFGCWKTCLSTILESQKYSQFKLNQVDWFLQLVTHIDGGMIYFGDYYEVEPVIQKGGYNIYEVFIDNFLYILRANDIKGVTLEIQKYRLLRYFIFPWKKRLWKSPNLYAFEKEKGNSIILREYWYYPYTYLLFAIDFINRKLCKFL